MSAPEILHLTGPIILGPEQEASEAWVVDGVIRYDRPELPAGAEPRRIDGFVVPGLADLHCHIGIGDGGEPLELSRARQQALTDRDTGVLLIRDAGSMVDTRPLQDHAEGAPGEDLSTLIRCGRHVARSRRYLRGYANEVDPDELPDAVAEQARAGDGWVKLVADWIDRDRGDLSPTFGPEDFRAAADAAHTHGARITAHTFSEETLPLLLDAGFDCLEHATGLTDETITHAAAAGIPVVTTLVNVGEFTEYAAQGEPKFPTYAQHMRALHAGRYQRTRDALDAGVPLLVGTDSGGVLGHGIIHDELDELAAAGLTAPQILEAASFAPRRFLGAPALDEGAPADFVVTAQDPRTDHRTLRERTHGVLRGRVVVG